MADQVRVKVRYRGRVQGVGFRATVHQIASSYEVAGRVRNMLDGSVELVADGCSEELVRFCDAIATRMQRYITDQHSDWLDADLVDHYHSFEIAPSEG